MENEQVKRINLDKLEKIYPHTYFDMYFGISEPGYDDKPVILADWNPVPNKVQDAIEKKLGYIVEWSDEWTSCSNCGKLVRTSPDCYQWTPSYVIMDDELYCIDCIDAEEYYESIENNPKHAVTLNIADRYPPEDFGYEKVQGDYENGFYEGQNDDPEEILKSQLEIEPEGKFIFILTDKGQFDVHFVLYRKIEGKED